MMRILRAALIGMVIACAATAELGKPEQLVQRNQAVVGTFQALSSETEVKSVSEWQQLLSEVHAAGMEHMIIQWLQYDGEPIHYRQQLEDLLSACEKTPVELIIGLSLSSAWWTEQSLTQTALQQALSTNMQLASQLQSRLSQHPCFQGWYIPQEAEAIPLTRQQLANLLHYYTELSSQLKRLTPNKLVTMSGYKQTGTPESFDAVQWWQHLLNQAAIDRLYFQDGYGVWRLSPLQSSQSLLYRLSKELDQDGSKLWLVIETFEQVNPASTQDKNFRAIPAQPQRLCLQIKQARSLGLPAVLYTYSDYLRSKSNSKAKPSDANIQAIKICGQEDLRPKD